jgi:murein DD-endopeptidase MepM/ murein hydrolase activator NlpD
MPLRDPLRLSSEFGPRRSPFNAEVEMHRGVDLVAGAGTPIYAAGGGVVKIAGRWQDYNYSEYGKLGKFILIEHGDTGYQSLYGHCSALLVKDGDVVEPGQVIARVGNTGWSTGPHLHFAIVYKNQFVDPKLYLLHFDSSKFLEEVLQDQDQTEREE